MKTNSKQINKWLLVGWFVSLFASLASLYFIEIKGNPAASLCWLERMLIFGVFLILSVAIYKKDYMAKYYAAPFVAIGITSAFYQQLVHWDIISVESASCSVSAVCATKFFELFGFITQASLCLAAFVIVALCLYKIKK